MKNTWKTHKQVQHAINKHVTCQARTERTCITWQTKACWQSRTLTVRRTPSKVHRGTPTPYASCKKNSSRTMTEATTTTQTKTHMD